MRLLPALACLIASLLHAGPALAGELHYYSEYLLELRGRDCQDEDGPLWPALQTLRRAADRSLEQEPLSVVSPDRPEDGTDVHDYVSYAPYWWPDPDREDGLPWINRDGERNPTSEAMPNRRDWSRLQGCLRDLCLAWHFTGDERYAEHAALLTRTWFLDEATRMNPSLRHAQGVPGRSDGSGWGIIDWAQLPALLDHITMLEEWPGWTEADRSGIRRWFSEYRNWLLNSDNGRVAANARNNHATYYDGQLASISLFLGDEDMARQVCEAAGEKRFEHMLAADGSQPLELRRTKSWDYSIYNLQAMVNLARLAEAVDVDLWHYRDPEGAGIREALLFLLPYAQGDKEWKWKQIKEIHYRAYISMLNELAWVDADESLPFEIGRIPEEMSSSDARLLYQW